MQRLSGLDAAFLGLETPTNHMHVMAVAVVDPSTAPRGFGYAQVRRLLEERLHLLPPFRRRLVEVPFALHHPLWIDDPDFDLDFHLRRVAVPSPGGGPELAELAADIAGRQLDRSRPLWQVWVVEGLEHGLQAVVSKVHHAAIDGMSGVELIAALFDLEPDPAPPAGAPAPFVPDRVPADQELVAHALGSLARHPVLVARAVRNLGRAAVRVRRRLRDDLADVTVPLRAPRLAMNGAITPHRKIAFASVSLTDVKVVKNALGVKVNDVVLAVAAGALRSYLLARGELPDRPLVATIPTSVRTEEQRADMGNRVSALFTALPVDRDDPLDRLEAIHRSTVAAKVVHDDVGGNTLHEWAELAAPAVFARAARLYSRLRMADRHRPVHNLIVSNVPGPPFPLYLAGARLVSLYPLGPVFDGAGLNLTVISYLDSVGFGFLAYRELVADVDDLAAAVPDALAELVKVAEAR